jgi:hypothetical protein
MKYLTKKNILLALIAISMLIIGMGINPAEAHALGVERPTCDSEDGYLFRDAHRNIVCKLYKKAVVEPKVTARPVRQTRRQAVTRISRSRVVRSPLKARITKSDHKPIVYTRMSQRSIRRQISHELESYDQDAEIERIREEQRKYSERRLSR